MTASDLDAIDPALSGADMVDARTGSGVSVLLILAICVGFAVLVAAAISVFMLTGSAWFGSALRPLAVWFLVGAAAG